MIDLSVFLSAPLDERGGFPEPFAFDGERVIACNRNMLIEVHGDARDLIDPQQAATVRTPKGMAEMELGNLCRNHLPGGDIVWHAVAAIVLPDHAECPGCWGTGEEVEDGDIIGCEGCHATGERIVPVQVGAQSFQRRYLAALAALPDCEIGLRPDARPDAMAYIRFAGGRGLIMPTRVGVERRYAA
jgi:hypothetical protein